VCACDFPEFRARVGAPHRRDSRFGGIETRKRDRERKREKGGGERKGERERERKRKNERVGYV